MLLVAEGLPPPVGRQGVVMVLGGCSMLENLCNLNKCIGDGGPVGK